MNRKAGPETPTSNERDTLEVVDYQVGAEGYRDVASYDQKRYVGTANEYRQSVMASAYNPLIGNLEGKSVLDVGCGSGRGIVAFASSASLAIGCDASVDMLGATARKLKGRKSWGLACAYAQQLPFASDSFDVVSTFNFLHLFSVPTQRQMVSEIKRVTKPGGTILLEFDNAIHGLVLLGLYKRWFRQERGTLPWEARLIIGDNCSITKVRTAALPIVWRIFCRAPKFFLHVEKLTHIPIVNRILGQRIYYRLTKAR